MTTPVVKTTVEMEILTPRAPQEVHVRIPGVKGPYPAIPIKDLTSGQCDMLAANWRDQLDRIAEEQRRQDKVATARDQVAPEGRL